MNTNEILNKAKNMLINANIPNLTDVNFILAYVLNVDSVSEILNKNISKAQIKKYFKLIKQRIKKVPLDKILGYTNFLDVKIPFSKHVLTPRQETEILADMIIKDMPKKSNIAVLDLCTGSGCIGLAIAKHTSADVTISDISKKAIKIAAKNAKINDIKVSIIKSDLFDNICTKFDIIICNPPYIKKDDIKSLEKEVKKFDPLLALDGGKDGLEFYRKIVKLAPEYLNKSGSICFEIGFDQKEQVRKLLEDDFVDIQVIKDYSGIDRFVVAKKRLVKD